MSAIGQHNFQQPELIKRNRERTRDQNLDLSAIGQHPWHQPELIERNHECTRERTRDRNLVLSAIGQRWQQPELIKRNREPTHDRLLDLSAIGQHPWQQPELIKRNRDHTHDLSAIGQHPWQQPEFIEHECEKKSKKQIVLIAQGKHVFVTDNLAKKKLKKLFEELKSTHYIDIYDKTSEYHRQWPNKAWPPQKNSVRFEEGVQKKRNAFTVAELKQMGVTPATRLHGIGCTHTSLVHT